MPPQLDALLEAHGVQRRGAVQLRCLGGGEVAPKVDAFGSAATDATVGHRRQGRVQHLPVPAPAALARDRLRETPWARLGKEPGHEQDEHGDAEQPAGWTATLCRNPVFKLRPMPAPINRPMIPPPTCPAELMVSVGWRISNMAELTTSTMSTASVGYRNFFDRQFTNRSAKWMPEQSRHAGRTTHCDKVRVQDQGTETSSNDACVEHDEHPEMAMHALQRNSQDDQDEGVHARVREADVRELVREPPPD
eukprot:CAMPEP_0176290068 /NCGR_PEP_ID=MMETSP0121_2-20121125/54828_1 /TAXON_ID=160619 /ORGANISM="Kryptoperidinium foliaceum, Strain CCMP 1326" /LENGTH=249 /DNA_ID=CAMNT_0017630839 /DNA_START=300 /DNA_END=1047 /DNA_ORIENTATION=-